jgi:hypothetical protein
MDMAFLDDAVTKGERRLFISESGWPMVDISQLTFISAITLTVRHMSTKTYSRIPITRGSVLWKITLSIL